MPSLARDLLQLVPMPPVARDRPEGIVPFGCSRPAATYGAGLGTALGKLQVRTIVQVPQCQGHI